MFAIKTDVLLIFSFITGDKTEFLSPMLFSNEYITGISVSRFTETDRNGPERTETDRNGPKRTFVDTETDSLSTETDSLGTETDRNGPKRTFVNTETDSVGTES